MKKFICLIGLLAAGLPPMSAQAATPTLSELLQIQQSVNTACLVRGQGRARMLCRCTAVVVSNKLAAEGTADYQEQAETLYEQSFEYCMAHEDRGFVSSTAKLYQSKTAVEESLKGNDTKPDTTER
ncbi:MAG: hypothetical protein WCO62_09760 [Betaproteobacteria bacterium]|jgi:hypothetical protein